MADFVRVPETDWQAICNATREKTGNTDKMVSGSVAEEIDKVFESGKQAEADAFWDLVLDCGERNCYEYAFRKWNCEYLRPKYKVIHSFGRCCYMFSDNKSLKKIESQYFDISKHTVDESAFLFANCENLEEMEDIGLKTSHYSRTWYGCTKLRTIEIIRSDASTKYTLAFLNCKKLENVTFDGVIGTSIDFGSSPLLSASSLESIVTALADKTGGEAMTLTLHPDAAARLTDEQKAAISAKNWTLVT